MELVGRRLGIVVVLVAVVVSAGCGGSSGPESSVNGCEIRAATSCPMADLAGVNLSGADLSHADLYGASLEGTDLSSANLTAANLGDAQIVEANLSDADLTDADLTGATITGTDLDGATLCGTTRTDGTIDDSSCPASTDTTGTTETTSTSTSTSTEATVVSFEVGQLECSADVSVGSVTATWSTEATTAVALSVDGQIENTAGPDGSTELQVPCDDETHVVSIAARNDSGTGETESKEVGSD